MKRAITSAEWWDHIALCQVTWDKQSATRVEDCKDRITIEVEM